MINIITIVSFFIGLAIGAATAFGVLWKPYEKGFDEGWKCGKQFYANWDKGFHAGWEGCIESISEITSDYLEAKKAQAKKEPEE